MSEDKNNDVEDTTAADTAREQSLDDAMSVLSSEQDWTPDPSDRGDYLPDDPEPEVPVELDSVEEPVKLKEEVEDEGVVQEAASEPEAEKPHMIPKSRLDSQIRKTRELEEAKIRMEEQMKFLQAQIDANNKPAQEQQAPEPEKAAFDYAAAYKQMQELTLDGEPDRAAEVFQEILSQQQASMEDKFNQQIAQSYDNNRFQETIQRELAEAATEITAIYPELDIQNEQAFDSRLTGEINELMGALTTIQKEDGMPKYTPAQALRQAVAMKMPAPPAENKELGTNQTAPAGNVKKKVAAANNQPPTLPGDRGTSHGQTPRIDPLNMTEEDFDALPASTLARLRGDI